MEMWAAWLAPILAHVATSHWTLVKWWNLQFGYRVWHWLKLHIQRISWVTWVHFQRSDKIPRSSKGCTCSQASIPDIPRLQQLLQVHGVVTATTQSSPGFQGCLQQWYFWLLFGNMCHGQKLDSFFRDDYSIHSSMGNYLPTKKIPIMGCMTIFSDTLYCTMFLPWHVWNGPNWLASWNLEEFAEGLGLFHRSKGYRHPFEMQWGLSSSPQEIHVGQLTFLKLWSAKCYTVLIYVDPRWSTLIYNLDLEVPPSPWLPWLRWIARVRSKLGHSAGAKQLGSYGFCQGKRGERGDRGAGRSEWHILQPLSCVCGRGDQGQCGEFWDFGSSGGVRRGVRRGRMKMMRMNNMRTNVRMTLTEIQCEVFICDVGAPAELE